jgi:hypothetical protein
MTMTRIHGHAATLEAVGQCPSCRAKSIERCAAAPHGWVLWFPDTKQIAVVRTWAPGGEDEPVCTAWATGCNTGDTIGYTPLDLATIEASGVELFRLLSGSAVNAALDALGVDPPWNHDIVQECPCCGDPVVIEADRDEP